MYPENTSRKKPFIIVAIIIVLLVIVTIVLAIATSSSNDNKGGGPKGTLEISYNMSDTIGVVVKLNGKTQKTTEKYSVAPGKYQLQISRPGYTTFKTDVTVKENSDVLVSVRNDLVEAPPADSVQTLAPLLPSSIQNPRIKSVNYFYANTWAVVHFDSDQEDGDVAVLRYFPETQQWSMLNDPGVVVDINQIGDAPAAVLSYLNDNNLIFSGD
ncbi:MAG TPA: PEGA domain-containing protein [Candidatus Saccharimonadales bacterium]|nr:PEGA domain-containing protein [Candidatus Saccharimonadales bacterium]